MALKPDRDYFSVDDVSHFWNPSQAVAVEKGGIASKITSGSGVSLDDKANQVGYAADPSGAVPVGLMLADVAVYPNTTRFFRNFHNGEVLPGEKVCLTRKGWVVTNCVSGTPTAGASAYLAENGNLSPTQLTGAPKVGRFETTKDADGFAKVFIDV